MPGKPALQAFVESKVGGGFNVTIDLVSVPAAGILIAPNDFERMALQIINTGGTALAVSPTANQPNTTGILIGANGGNITMNADQDLAMVGWSWYAIPLTGTGMVTVIKTTRVTLRPNDTGSN